MSSVNTHDTTGANKKKRTTNTKSYRRYIQSESLLDGLDHISIGPVPVGPLAEAHHLPRDHSIRPHVRRARELGVRNSLGRRPPHRNLATLGPIHALSRLPILDLTTQPEVSHLTLQLLIHQNIPGRQIPMHKTHTRQVPVINEKLI